MKPGVYDILITDYHEGLGVSRSGIMEYKRSPLHYYHKYVSPHPKERREVDIITVRNAMDFGNAFHTYVLEHDKYYKEYHVVPKMNRVTKKGKEEYKKALENAGGKYLIDAEAQKIIGEMAAQIDFHPEASVLLKDALYEKSLFWDDVDTGLLCKARPDVWNKNFIVDLKTTANAGKKEFSRAIHNFGYHIQCGMIHEALKSLNKQEMTNFIFVVVEKDPPYAVVVYTLNEEDLRLGIEEFKSTLYDMKENYETGQWSSYQSSTISLPGYAKKTEEDLT